MAKERFIQRHSLQTRITHCTVAIACIWLAISGLFVFIQPLAAAVPDVARFMRLSHRIVGCIFILTPIVSAITAPKGVKRMANKYFTKWTPEDKEWFRKFVPYMLNAKRVHMPDQDEVKSGQRISDGVMIVAAFFMAVSGVVLWLGLTVFDVSPGTIGVMRLVHDIFFLVLVIFVTAHVFLGGGIFQPYRSKYGMIKLMFGSGQISESDALYHWGFWAREELEKGDNVVWREVDENHRVID